MLLHPDSGRPMPGPASRAAVLAGGPAHGRRLDGAYQEYVTVPAADGTLTPVTRPSRWRHPWAWRRWRHPAVVGLVASRSFTSHLYHRNGTLGDGTAVYWHCGPDRGDPPPDSGTAMEAVEAVLAAAAAISPRDWASPLHWEMSRAWFEAVMASPLAWSMPGAAPERLNGWPLKLTYGSPRLVRDDLP